MLTRSGGSIAGAVSDRAGSPVPDATVIVFADDSARWGIGTRFVTAARSNRNGRFTTGGMPPGRYRAIAKDFVADGQWLDPAFLNSVAADAITFDVAPRETKTIALRLEAQP